MNKGIPRCIISMTLFITLHRYTDTEFYLNKKNIQNFIEEIFKFIIWSSWIIHFKYNIMEKTHEDTDEEFSKKKQ